MLAELGNMIGRALLFGVAYAVAFIVVERVAARRTGWGEYLKGLLKVLDTPAYLIPIWVGLAGLTAFVALLLLNSGIQVGIVALVCAALMGAINLFGEGFGVWVTLWRFAPRKTMVLGVPLWVPLSYGLAFTACPWLSGHPIGGIVQALLVGVAWLIVSKIIP
jgi:hypothetical protein